MVSRSPEALRSMIAAGETETVEFKSTMRFAIQASPPVESKDVKLSALKTVCAFLNSRHGGTLIVGIDDRGTAIGIQEDHWESEDRYSQHFASLIKTHFGAEYSDLIQSHFADYNERRIFVAECAPSDRAVFLQWERAEEFYVRNGTTTEKLSSRQCMEYCARRYGLSSSPPAGGAGSGLPKVEQLRTNLPPLYAVWVGRDDEICNLSDGYNSVVAITGIGGQGKSALAARFAETIGSQKFDRVLWRDCREEGNTLVTHFATLLEEITGRELLASELSESSPDDLAELLFDQIRTRNILVILDNVDKYVDLSSGEPVPPLRTIVLSVVRSRCRGKLLLTCRPSLAVADADAFLEQRLGGLTLSDAVELFHLRGVDTILHASEIQRAHDYTQGHALWLNLIATQVSKNKASISSLIGDAPSAEPGLPVARLRTIWKTLHERERRVLTLLTVAPAPLSQEEIVDAFSGAQNWNQTQKALRALRRLSLIVPKAQGSNELFELHPIIRDFVRREVDQVERARYSDKLEEKLRKNVQKFPLSGSELPPVAVLEIHIMLAELLIGSRKFRYAIEALSKVASGLLRAGFADELLRLCAACFTALNWSDLVNVDDPALDDVVRLYSHTLAEFGDTDRALEVLSNYESVIPGKSARYILLCNLRAYVYWLARDYSSAVRWGELGARLKSESNIDTTWDCEHNLALALRDSGDVQSALNIFIEDRSLEEFIRDAKESTKLQSSEVGNVGRCLFLLGKTDESLDLLILAAKLLQQEVSDVAHVNRGYASMWLGDALLRANDSEMAYMSYRNAAALWHRCCPARGRDALSAADQVIASRSDLDWVRAMPVDQVAARCSRYIERQAPSSR